MQYHGTIVAYTEARMDARVNVVAPCETNADETVVVSSVLVNSTLLSIACPVFRAAWERWQKANPPLPALSGPNSDFPYNYQHPVVELPAVSGVQWYGTVLKIAHSIPHEGPQADIARVRQYSLWQTVEILLVLHAWGMDHEWHIGESLIKALHDNIRASLATEEGRKEMMEHLDRDAAVEMIVRQHLGHFVMGIWTCKTVVDWGLKIGQLLELTEHFGSSEVFCALKASLSVPMDTDQLLSFGAYVKDMCDYLYGMAADRRGLRRWSITFSIAKWLFHPAVLVHLLGKVIARDEAMYTEVIRDHAGVLTAVDFSLIGTVTPALWQRDPELARAGSMLGSASFVHPTLPLASIKVSCTADKGGSVGTPPVSVKLSGTKGDGKTLAIELTKHGGWDLDAQPHVFYTLAGSAGHEMEFRHGMLTKPPPKSPLCLKATVGDVTDVHVIIVPRTYTRPWYVDTMRQWAREASGAVQTRVATAGAVMQDDAFRWAGAGDAAAPWIAYRHAKEDMIRQHGAAYSILPESSEPTTTG